MCARIWVSKELKLKGLQGSLQIGSASYTIFEGKGEVNKKGTVEINAKTNGGNGKAELKLHGTIQGENVIFNSPESKLSSLYFLSLTGKAALSMNGSIASTSKSENETVTLTVTQNNTITKTVTETVTQAGTNSTVTVTETVTQSVTTTVANSTLTVTTTVANSTITVTTTVANSTVTVTTT